MTRPPPPHSQFPVPDPARQLVLDTCLASEWLWLSVPLHLKRLSLRRSSFPLALADRSSGPLPRPPPRGHHLQHRHTNGNGLPGTDPTDGAARSGSCVCAMGGPAEEP